MVVFVFVYRVVSRRLGTIVRESIHSAEFAQSCRSILRAKRSKRRVGRNVSWSGMYFWRDTTPAIDSSILVNHASRIQTEPRTLYLPESDGSVIDRVVSASRILCI